MSKKLLSEAVVRRFAKLANINPINEMYEMGEEPVMEQEELEGEEAVLDDAELEAPVEMDADLEADAGEEMGMETEPEAQISDTELNDLVKAAEVIMDKLAPHADEAGEEMDLGDEEMEMDAEEEMDMGAEMPPMEIDAEEDIMAEALKGISYIPGNKEIVNEVAKRVAKRLLKAKKAEKQLQEALGQQKRVRRSKK